MHLEQEKKNKKDKGKRKTFIVINTPELITKSKNMNIISPLYLQRHDKFNYYLSRYIRGSL